MFIKTLPERKYNENNKVVYQAFDANQPVTENVH